MKSVVIRGDSGKLDGYFHRAMLLSAPSVLMLSGSPEAGYCMNTDLMDQSFRKFARRGFSVLRYDHSGVGRSEGAFKKNIGSLVDASLVVDWFKSSTPNSSKLIIFGFSYCAIVALLTFMRRPELTYFILVSPPECKSDSNFVSPCPGPGKIIYPSGDSKEATDATMYLYHRLSTQQRYEIRCVSVKDATHDFSNKIHDFLENLDDCVVRLIDNRLRSDKSIVHSRRRKKMAENALIDRDFQT